MTAPKASDPAPVRERPGVTIILVKGALTGVPAIRYWTNHGLGEGEHRLFTDPLPVSREAVEKIIERLILSACELGARRGPTVETRVATGLAAAGLRDPAVNAILALTGETSRE